MSEEQKKTEVKAAVDWHTDYFPTSARKVFMGWGVMLGGIAVLCASVYLMSEHPVDQTKVKKQTEVQERLQDVSSTDDE